MATRAWNEQAGLSIYIITFNFILGLSSWGPALLAAVLCTFFPLRSSLPFSPFSMLTANFLSVQMELRWCAVLPNLQPCSGASCEINQKGRRRRQNFKESGTVSVLYIYQSLQEHKNYAKEPKPHTPAWLSFVISYGLERAWVPCFSLSGLGRENR